MSFTVSTSYICLSIYFSICLIHFLFSPQHKLNLEDTLFVDLRQIMYSLPTYCLVLFFLFSLIHPITCGSSKQDLKLCETLFQCGTITAGSPFWGGNRQKHCGHPLLELQCNKNNNITSFFISSQEFNVLHIY